MAGKLLVTRGLGAKAFEPQIRTSLSQQGLCSASDCRCRSSTAQVTRSRMRRSRSARKCVEQRNRTRANRRRSIRRGWDRFALARGRSGCEREHG